jgi:hypothetical protein
VATQSPLTFLASGGACVGSELSVAIGVKQLQINNPHTTNPHTIPPIICLRFIFSSLFSFHYTDKPKKNDKSVKLT